MSNSGVSAGVKIVKGILYVALCAVAVVLVLLFLILGYNTAVQTTNVYMIAKDAFARRAQAVLLPTGGFSDREALEKLFTQSAIANDDVLNSTYYSAYKISNYYERADVDFKIIWPWEDQTEITVTETVLDIKGTVAEQNEASSQEGKKKTEEAPVIGWANGKYRVELKKDKQTQTWRIDGIELTEHIFVEESAAPSATETASENSSVPSAQPTQITISGGDS